jgi:hypothetical protein
MRQQRVLSASRPVPAEGCCYPNAGLPTVVPRGLMRRRMWVVGLRQPQTHVSAIGVYHRAYESIQNRTTILAVVQRRQDKRNDVARGA